MDLNTKKRGGNFLLRLFFLLLLTVPIIEISIFITLGKSMGMGYTLALIIGTAILGASLLHRQSLSTLAKIRANSAEGRLPTTALVEGLVLLIGAILLLTPGFFTDIFGFISVIPSLRKKIAQYLLAHFLQWSAGTRPASSNRIFEGEYWDPDLEKNKAEKEKKGLSEGV